MSRFRTVKSELFFPCFMVIHLAVWAVGIGWSDQSTALFPEEAGWKRVAGEVLSTWVIVAFAFNLLMTTRAAWVERIFGGLDKMYLVHRRSGVVAAIAILLHFGITPSSPDFSIGKPLGVASMVLISVGVVLAISPAMKRRIPYDKWASSHRLMGLFYLVGVAHSALVPSLTSRIPLVRVYVYVFAGVGVAAWIFRTFVSRLGAPTYAYRVSAVHRFGESLVDIRLKAVGERITYKAGQFAFFAFGKHAPNESHPFTIASHPSSEELRVVVRASGDFSSSLVRGVAPGETVRVKGPHGHLHQEHFRHPRQLWVAGGVGITPFLAMARELDGAKVSATLIWSVRDEADAVFDAELREIASKRDGFCYVRWDSRERGYFDFSQKPGGWDAGTFSAVVCGPGALRDGLTDQLVEAGTTSIDVHSEEFAFR